MLRRGLGLGVRLIPFSITDILYVADFYLKSSRRRCLGSRTTRENQEGC